MSGRLAAALALSLATGLCGLRWGLPGRARLAAFPDRLAGSADFAERLSRGWEELYRGIERTHSEAKGEEPVTYVQGVEEIAPGWDWPPPKLANSYRSLLLRTEHPDEQKTFVVLSRMRPWKLELEPLYVQYGGAFVYPVGAFLGTAHVLHLARLVSDMRHYLMHPDDMGRLFLLARLFIIAFNVGTIAILYDLGRRLNGPDVGLAASAAYALCPLVVINSHVLKPHVYAAFWCLAAVRFAYMAARGEGRRSYLWSGLCAGVAAGSNFSFLVFAALPAAAWLARRAKAERGAAAAACACAAAVFALTNPYVFLAGRKFIWETTVYAAGGRLSPSALRDGAALLGPQLARQMGLVAELLAAAGLWRALRSRDAGRRFLGWTLAGAGALLWAGLTFFWGFMGGPEALRFFFPLFALGCLLAADGLLSSSLPRWAKAAGVAALLIDGSVRSGAYLANLRLDSSPAGTRSRAAAWIAANIRPGAAVGLSRYPQPSSTPPFRYDLYRLVIFQTPDALSPARYPDYLVVDEPGRAAVEASRARRSFDPVQAFVPVTLAWGRVYDPSFFANAAMYVYKRRAQA